MHPVQGRCNLIDKSAIFAVSVQGIGIASIEMRGACMRLASWFKIFSVQFLVKFWAGFAEALLILRCAYEPHRVEKRT